MSQLVQEAKTFSTQAHRRINQVRKYTGNPYEVHLKGVAELVESVTEDPEMIAAAWLHDVVEDTPTTVDDLERAFGPGVAALVRELTDVSRPSDGNRSARASINREHLASASARAKTIKLADVIDNCRDIVRHDRRFAPIFLAEMAALLEVLGDGDRRLYSKARLLLSESSERLGLGRTNDAAEALEVEDQPLEREMLKRHRRTLELFARTFTAADIAESLTLYDPAEPSRPLGSGSPRVRGVREGGMVRAFIRHRDAEPNAVQQQGEPVGNDQIIDENAPLADVIEVLTRHDYCFVRTGDQIASLIDRAGIQKPVARMWLFGIIMLVETYFTQRIRELWKDESWTALLSPRRLQAAEQLRAERTRRNQPCEIIDCLQFADKAEILLQNPAQPAQFGFASRGAAKHVIKELQSLRNNLAHGQDVTVRDWPQIVRLARRVEELYSKARD